MGKQVVHDRSTLPEASQRLVGGDAFHVKAFLGAIAGPPLE